MLKSSLSYDRAQTALDQGSGMDCDATDLVDLLTDLRHWADVEEVDLHEALRISYDHYLSEKEAERL
jgi:hypothetical protein